MAKLTFDDEFTSLHAGTYGQGQPWSYAYSWSPNGYADANLSSYIVNPNGLPADANVYSDQNGLLSIAAKNTPSDVSPSSVGNDPYLSGQITTKDSFSQQYGYFETRMQAPTGGGISSAFWMLPQNGAWPPEIDAPEIDSNPTAINWGIHGVNNAMPQTETFNQPDSSTGMHVYAVDWEPDTITFYEDGKQVSQAQTPSNMQNPMYLLLDTAVSKPGGWNGDPSSTMNQALNVDYVRAYASNPYANGLTNPDWSNHGTTASTYTPQTDASGNLTGFTGGSAAAQPMSAAAAAPSPDNTVITSAGGGSITDASGNAWSIASNGQVAVNGTPDGQSGNVVELAYEKGQIWQENTDHMWWSKSSPSDTWGPTYGTSTSPVPAGTPATTAPPSAPPSAPAAPAPQPNPGMTPLTSAQSATVGQIAASNPPSASLLSSFYRGENVGSDLSAYSGVSGNAGAAQLNHTVADMVAFLSDFTKSGSAGQSVGISPDFAVGTVGLGVKALQSGNQQLIHSYGAAVSSFYGSEATAYAHMMGAHGG